MFCSKCGNQINQGERFCGVCGNSVHTASVQYHPPVTKIKNKKWIAVTISIILVICLIIGGLFIPLIGFINKIKTKGTQEILNILSDGYWMTMDYHNTIDMLDYDYYNDFGLIFSPKMYYSTWDDSSTTQLAVTTDGQVLEYVIDPFNETNCCTLYYTSGGSSTCSSFLIDYDETNDVLAVTVVAEFLDRYNFFDTNLEENLVIYLSHFHDNDENTELEKKLYFENWSDADGDYSGPESWTMDTHFSKNPDATIYRFFKNKNRQFNNCDISLFEYTLGNNGYTYQPTNYDFDKEHNIVGLSFNDSTYEYFRYDEEENCLINDNNGRKIYCVSNHTEFSDVVECESYGYRFDYYTSFEKIFY